MADSTDKKRGADRSRAQSALATAVALLALLSGLIWPAVGVADGDPASDVLAGQLFFLPADAGLTARQLPQLSGLLAEAEQAGLPLRLAVVASPADLGSVTALWHQPQLYARFLDQELSSVFTGELVVVMPNGIGLAQAGRVPARGAALAGPRSSRPGPGLGRLAIAAVRSVAAADGHPLAPVAVGAVGSSGSGDAGAVLALIIGLVLIAVSWAASLRARPLRVARR